MPKVQVGPDHVVANVIHVQILRDTSQPNAQQAFYAQINAPGFSQELQIGNGVSKTYTLAGVIIGGVPANPQVLVEVDNFQLLPAGTNSANATALSFLLVFKLVEIFKITIGSIQVTSSLH